MHEFCSIAVALSLCCGTSLEAAIAGPANTVSTKSVLQDDWPQIDADSHHSRWLTQAVRPPLRVAWKHLFAGRPIVGSIVARESIYVGIIRPGMTSAPFQLLAIDPIDQHVRWVWTYDLVFGSNDPVYVVTPAGVAVVSWERADANGVDMLSEETGRRIRHAPVPNGSTVDCLAVLSNGQLIATETRGVAPQVWLLEINPLNGSVQTGDRTLMSSWPVVLGDQRPDDPSQYELNPILMGNVGIPRTHSSCTAI